MRLDVALRHGSLTDGDEDVLVDASNTGCDLGSGVSGAIRNACGAGYQAQIHRDLRERFGGPMEPGDVLVTGAGSHPRAKWVAHVAVMDYRRSWDALTPPDEARIERGCANLWRAIDTIDAGSLSVAMVALGAGTGGMGVRRPTEIACSSLQAHLVARPHTRIRRVVFYGFELYELVAMAEVVTAAFPSACASLDEETLASLDRLRT